VKSIKCMLNFSVHLSTHSPILYTAPNKIHTQVLHTVTLVKTSRKCIQYVPLRLAVICHRQIAPRYFSTPNPPSWIYHVQLLPNIFPTVALSLDNRFPTFPLNTVTSSSSTLRFYILKAKTLGSFKTWTVESQVKRRRISEGVLNHTAVKASKLAPSWYCAGSPSCWNNLCLQATSTTTTSSCKKASRKLRCR
jgi:hypothetical protein